MYINDFRIKIHPRPLVYVAGPYGSSGTQEQIDANVALADVVARRLTHLGYAPIVPHKNTYGWEKDISIWKPELFMVDLSILMHCQALVYVGMATGVAAEIGLAERLNIPIFSDEELFALQDEVPVNGSEFTYPPEED